MTWAAVPSVVWTILAALVSGALVWWIRGMPERKRVGIDESKALFDEWHQLKESVDKKLGEVEQELINCHRERTLYVQQISRLNEENFRLRLVVTLILDEIAKLDPESTIAAKARVIMATPTAVPELPDNPRPLGELLEEMDVRTAGATPQRPRRRRKPEVRQ